MVQVKELALSEYVRVRSVTQSCLTLCNPMDCSLPGSSVHGCDPSQIRHIRSQERNPEVPASTCHEALFHCTKPSGVPRGPSQLHSDPDFSEAR